MSWKLFTPATNKTELSDDWRAWRTDQRALAELNDVVTLDDLRKQNILSSQRPPPPEPKASPTGDLVSHGMLSKLQLPKIKPHSAAGSVVSGMSSLEDTQTVSSRHEKAAAVREAAGDGHGWHPLKSAKLQLAIEKPGMLTRMEDAVEQCRIARDNRNFRLNSLGVFENSTNEVRARSMLRVHMHKELSTTSMRLPQQNKELKLERPDDSLNARLERMCHRVLKSIDEPTPALSRQRTMASKTRDRRMSLISTNHTGPPGSKDRDTSLSGAPIASFPGLQGYPGSGAMLASPGQAQYTSSTDIHSGLGDVGGDGFGLPSPVQRQSSRHVPPMRQSMGGGRRRSQYGGGSGGKVHRAVGSPGVQKSVVSGTGHAKYEWIKTTLPPELAAAHIQHLMALTEQHIDKYHRTVSQAQDEALTASGLRHAAEVAASVAAERAAAAAEAASEQEKRLGMSIMGALDGFRSGAEDESQKAPPSALPTTASGLLSAGPEVLEEALQAADAMQGSVGQLGQGGAKEQARQALETASIPELISRALSHVAVMSEELNEFKASLPKDVVKSTHRRHRKPSVPMYKQASFARSAASSTAGTRPGTEQESRASSMLRGVGRGDMDDDEGSEASDDGNFSAGELSGGVGASPRVVPGAPPPAPSPPPPPPQQPIINHTPITEKWLSTFVAKMDQACQPEALAALHLPALSNLPPAPTAALHIQARLERVWDALLMPLPMRLDMVLLYTQRERAGKLESALDAWEAASVAVISREDTLLSLSYLQSGVEEARLGHVSVSAVERQCIDLIQLSALVDQHAKKLKEEFSFPLTFDGQPYPSLATMVGKEQLVDFMVWLRDAPHLKLLS